MNTIPIVIPFIYLPFAMIVILYPLMHISNHTEKRPNTHEMPFLYPMPDIHEMLILLCAWITVYIQRHVDAENGVKVMDVYVCGLG